MGYGVLAKSRGVQGEELRSKTLKPAQFNVMLYCSIIKKILDQETKQMSDIRGLVCGKGLWTINCTEPVKGPSVQTSHRVLLSTITAKTAIGVTWKDMLVCMCVLECSVCAATKIVVHIRLEALQLRQT